MRLKKSDLCGNVYKQDLLVKQLDIFITQITFLRDITLFTGHTT